MPENNSILEKLDGLEARYEEVSTLITDPAVIADQQRYVKLTKEYKDLDDIMKARKRYEGTQEIHRLSQCHQGSQRHTGQRERSRHERDGSRRVVRE